MSEQQKQVKLTAKCGHAVRARIYRVLASFQHAGLNGEQAIPVLLERCRDEKADIHAHDLVEPLERIATLLREGQGLGSALEGGFKGVPAEESALLSLLAELAPALKADILYDLATTATSMIPQVSVR